MVRIACVAGCGLLAAPVLLVVFVVVLIGGSAGASASPFALTNVPADRLVLYQEAAARFGVDWAVLAAIGKVECDHGRLELAGCSPVGSVNRAGATGPMQFLGPTWRSGTPLGRVPEPGPATMTIADGYATDGDGDGVADVWDPADAISGAARYLRVNGAPGDYRRAIRAYNHSDAYVEGVLVTARRYRGTAPATLLSSGRAGLILGWALAHVGRYAYSQGGSTDRGSVSVRGMVGREPGGSTCDCSMFARWAYAQAGLDVGLTTVDQWTAQGLLPDSDAAAVVVGVARGVGPDPPAGGYRPADLVFFGHGAGAAGHVALYLADGRVVQCSASGNGSNVRELAGYVTPTGWIRYAAIDSPHP